MGTAEQALNHQWISNGSLKAKSVFLQPNIVGNLCSFQAYNAFKKAALRIIAGLLSESQIKSLRKTFHAIDHNGDGQLTMMEIKESIQKAGFSKIPLDLQQIMEAIDTDGTGVIAYTAFIAAALDKKEYLQETVCWDAFNVFAHNGDG